METYQLLIWRYLINPSLPVRVPPALPTKAQSPSSVSPWTSPVNVVDVLSLSSVSAVCWMSPCNCQIQQRHRVNGRGSVDIDSLKTILSAQKKKASRFSPLPLKWTSVLRNAIPNLGSSGNTASRSPGYQYWCHLKLPGQRNMYSKYDYCILYWPNVTGKVKVSGQTCRHSDKQTRWTDLKQYPLNHSVWSIKIIIR